MKLAVLNPGGSDPDQHFAEGAGAPESGIHPPVNFHAYAACTNGSFFRRDDAAGKGYDGALVLLRRKLKASRQAFTELRRARVPLMVSLKETGAAQIAETLGAAGDFTLFQELLQRADGAIAPTEDLVQIYRGAGARAVEFIPTPYPVEDPRWDFSIPIEERHGIFLGTREFRTASRNHLAALLVLKPLAEAMHEPVTVVNDEGWRGRRLLARLGYAEGLLQVREGRQPYPAYLRMVARHRLIFQLDASAVPGQVAGDALLCRVPCIGGNGTVERLTFPDLCGHGRSHEQLFDLAARLLEHPHDSAAVSERAETAAKMYLSFGAVSRQLEELYRRFRR